MSCPWRKSWNSMWIPAFGRGCKSSPPTRFPLVGLPQLYRLRPRLVEPEGGDTAKAALGQRDAVLQTDVRRRRLLGPGDGIEGALRRDNVHRVAYHDRAPADLTRCPELPQHLSCMGLQAKDDPGFGADQH